ncbi:hypothetical protein BU23DRAFT_661669 [Bimuria novae-zelandiae CBS 107.79]|uniref:Uncharacterized protein n=1 Tax=Bimuria novae-zelandiae CBS 107.79 TaxID=1447943 RepID=A0A6A5UPB8_9PLEO|nr:hypothetical protein BU23DRAFT_661669 [Bimuria novae-zelandiae CBS 107.79]
MYSVPATMAAFIQRSQFLTQPEVTWLIGRNLLRSFNLHFGAVKLRLLPSLQSGSTPSIDPSHQQSSEMSVHESSAATALPEMHISTRVIEQQPFTLGILVAVVVFGLVNGEYTALKYLSIIAIALSVFCFVQFCAAARSNSLEPRSSLQVQECDEVSGAVVIYRPFFSFIQIWIRNFPGPDEDGLLESSFPLQDKQVWWCNDYCLFITFEYGYDKTRALNPVYAYAAETLDIAPHPKIWIEKSLEERVSPAGPWWSETFEECRRIAYRNGIHVPEQPPAEGLVKEVIQILRDLVLQHGVDQIVQARQDLVLVLIKWIGEAECAAVIDQLRNKGHVQALKWYLTGFARQHSVQQISETQEAVLSQLRYLMGAQKTTEFLTHLKNEEQQVRMLKAWLETEICDHGKWQAWILPERSRLFDLIGEKECIEFFTKLRNLIGHEPLVDFYLQLQQQEQVQDLQEHLQAKAIDQGTAKAALALELDQLAGLIGEEQAIDFFRQIQDEERRRKENPKTKRCRQDWLTWIFNFAAKYTAEKAQHEYFTKAGELVGTEGAQVFFSTLGEYTQDELSQFLRQADSYAHREAFPKEVRLGKDGTEALFRDIFEEELHRPELKAKALIRNIAKAFEIVSVKQIQERYFDWAAGILGHGEAQRLFSSLSEEEAQQVHVETLLSPQLSDHETDLQKLLEEIEEEWGENDAELAQDEFAGRLEAMLDVDAEFAAQLRAYFLRRVHDFAVRSSVGDAIDLYDEQVYLILHSNLGLAHTHDFWDELKKVLGLGNTNTLPTSDRSDDTDGSRPSTPTSAEEVNDTLPSSPEDLSNGSSHASGPSPAFQFSPPGFSGDFFFSFKCT